MINAIRNYFRKRELKKREQMFPSFCIVGDPAAIERFLSAIYSPQVEVTTEDLIQHRDDLRAEIGDPYIIDECLERLNRSFE